MKIKNIFNPLSGKFDIVNIQTEFYNNISSFPLVGSVDILYIAKNTGIDYIWNGTAYISALNAKQNILTANSINNTLLAQMPANTIKVNATNATANAQDLLVNPNSIVGRDNDINSGNITSIPLQKTLIGSATLIAGSVVIFDTNITTTSICVGIAISNTGTITSVPIRWTASAGQMTFNTGQIGDTATFGYIILI